MAKPIDAILAASQPEQMMTVNPTLSTNQVQPEIVNVNNPKVMADNIANMDLIREATQKGIDVPTLLAQKKAEGAIVQPQPSAYDTMVQSTQNMSPAPVMEPQVTVQQQQPQAVVMPQESIAPDPVAVSAKVAQRKEQMEDQIANEVATESTAQQIENQVQEETQRSISKIDDEIKAIGPQQLGDYFNQGSIWQKLLAGISLGLGGYYSGMTGRENPALQILTKAVEGNRELRKLKTDERNKIIAAQADLLASRLKSYENDPNRSPMARMKMQEARLGLENQALDIRKKLVEIDQLKAKAVGGGLGLRVGQQAGLEAIDALPEDQRERAIYLPNNKIALASTKKQKEEFDKFQAEALPAIQTVRRVEELLKDYRKIPITPEDFAKKGKIESDLIKLSGNLRLAYLGPGAMTDQEYQRLQNAVGQPTKILSIFDAQRARLRTVEGSLKSDAAERLRQAGIKADVTELFGLTEDEQIEELTRKTIEKAKARGLPVPSEKTIREAWKKGRGE